MVTTTPGQDKRHALAASARVVVSFPNGAVLPVHDDLEEYQLGWPDLCVLHALAGGRPDKNASEIDTFAPDPASCPDLMEALRVRGWLVPGGQESEPGSGGSGDKAAGEPRLSVVGQAPAPEQKLIAESPLVLRVTPGGFESLDHDGALRACLSPGDLLVLSGFSQPNASSDLLPHLNEAVTQAGEGQLDQTALSGIVERLYAAGLLLEYSGGNHEQAMQSRKWDLMAKRMVALTELNDKYIADCLNREGKRARETGQQRTRVVPVMRQRALPPLALGMLISAAKSYEGGRLQKHYHFVPDWEPRMMRLEHYAREPGVFLFSSYIWSHQDNLEISAKLKQQNPDIVTIHGGPDVPKYQIDTDAYFRNHPHVDIAVHGEGEQTLCHVLEVLAGHFGDGPVDLSPLKHVPGLTFRLGDELVRTAPREQVRDLDSLPSPYLDGSFEVYEQAPADTAIVETNRGCPYGCTFCDWGSATASKVRRFDLDRVFAELEWCSRNQVRGLFLADANFGMFERDVQIAEKVAEFKRKYGYPKAFITNYAKNKVKYVKQIVTTLADAGILSEGLLSLQSVDQATLEAIDRSNIKTEKYHELAVEFRNAGLPLFLDIMVGLPGSTRESFAGDLQECVDHEIFAKVFQTHLLVNSPMNAPDYREKYQIETGVPANGAFSSSMVTDSSKVVVATSTFTREDYREMLDMRQLFRLAENFGILRQVNRFMRHVTGIREIDFIKHLREEARAHPEQWPSIAFLVRSMPLIMAPPVSWKLFIDEIRQFILTHYDVPQDSALETVLRVQHALLPTYRRNFPLRLALEHDYAAWYNDMLEAKYSGAYITWPEHVRPLAEYPPAEFEVSDPDGLCKTGLGFDSDVEIYTDWELSSPIARPVAKRYQDYADSA